MENGRVTTLGAPLAPANRSLWCGLGNFHRSILSPVKTFSMTGPFSTFFGGMSLFLASWSLFAPMRTNSSLCLSGAHGLESANP